MGTIPLYGCCEALWCHSLKRPYSTISTRLYIQGCTPLFLLERCGVSHRMVSQQRSWALQESQPTECEVMTSANICLWQTILIGHRDVSLSHRLKAFVLQWSFAVSTESQFVNSLPKFSLFLSLTFDDIAVCGSDKATCKYLAEELFIINAGSLKS